MCLQACQPSSVCAPRACLKCMLLSSHTFLCLVDSNANGLLQVNVHASHAFRFFVLFQVLWQLASAPLCQVCFIMQALT